MGKAPEPPATRAGMVSHRVARPGRRGGRAYWTKARLLEGLRRYYRATGTAPTSTEEWHAAVDLTFAPGSRRHERVYPSASAILRQFPSFREAWLAAGVTVDRGWEPWSADEEWYVREAIGILPRATIAADLRRSDAAVKRWLYDHGLKIKDALGWTAHRFERVAQVPAHRLRGYMDRGELPYYKGSECTYFDPADFLVVEEVDWAHPPPELERAVRRALVERIVMTLEGRDWRAGRLYQPHPLRKTDRHYRWGKRLAKPGPKPVALEAGDRVRVCRPVPVRPFCEGRVGQIRLVYWTVNRQAKNSARETPEPQWMARVEFKRERRLRYGPRVTYSLPLSALEWVGPKDRRAA